MAGKHPQQVEALLVVSEQTGQIVEHDFSVDDIGATPLAEQAVRLQNVINFLAHESMLVPFVEFDGPAQKSYGKHADIVRANAREHIGELNRRAKREFAHATGHWSLLAAGFPSDEVKATTRELYEDFRDEYYGPQNNKKADNYRRRLARNVEVWRGILPPEEHTPKPQSPIETEAVVSSRDEEKLTTRGRLLAIFNDERAGFLPATHREKNTVLTYLDYLDSVEYPNGVSDQLLEVFRHQHKLPGGRMQDGRRAMESITYELGDYLSNAVNSHAALIELQRIMSDCPNPYVSIVEEAGKEHPGYGPIIRFIDLSAIRDGSPIARLRRDPLRTGEDRWMREGPGKHKQVEDKYTAKERKPQFEEHIARSAEALTIGELRVNNIIGRAIANEEMRAAFFTDRLGDLRSLPGQRTFNSIFDIIDVTLEEYAPSE